MHLLVLSAFRHKKGRMPRKVFVLVSMHLLVLSAFRPSDDRWVGVLEAVSMHLLVLSAFRLDRGPFSHADQGLNAPFGAQCFPTPKRPPSHIRMFESQCTFWCSVLSDGPIGPGGCLRPGLNAPFGAQCFPTHHYRPTSPGLRSQCTFWCSVLSDLDPITGMAFGKFGLNAPFGAQCFPTRKN